MCILTYLPGGVAPDTDALHNGALTNPDGHGWAIVAGDRIIIGKSMNADEAISEFAAMRATHMDGPALFHSRIATAGVVTEYNIHPFIVGGDPRTVMAHNGIMPQAVQPGKKNPASDTRITAEKFIPQFGTLRSRTNRIRFEKWMGVHNKVVLLTVDRRFKEQAYILNEREGIWDGGIWYSNDAYLSWPTTIIGTHRQGVVMWWEDIDGKRTLHKSDYDKCSGCDAIIDYADDAYCMSCGWCLDCGEMPGVCKCYAPSKLDDGKSVLWPARTDAKADAKTYRIAVQKMLDQIDQEYPLS